MRGLRRAESDIAEVGLVRDTVTASEIVRKVRKTDRNKTVRCNNETIKSDPK